MGCAASASAQAPTPSAPAAVAPATDTQGVDLVQPTVDVYYVSGAGEAAVNGTYRHSGSHDDAPVYVHDNGGFRILRYRFKSGNAYWFITKWDLKAAAVSQHDLYRTDKTNASTPPAVWRDALECAGKTPSVSGKTAPKVCSASISAQPANADQDLGVPASLERRCTVSGAGEREANGLYLQSGRFDGVPQYVNEHGITLLRYRFKQSGRAYWFFSERDKDGKASQDRDLYRTPAPSEEARPPSTWIAAPSSKPEVVGKEPLPTILWQNASDVDEEEDGDKLESNKAVDMSYPTYWTTPSSLGYAGASFAKQVAPGKAVKAEVESLLKQTFTGKRTRDRKGRAMPSSLTLCNLQRVENSDAWNRYAARRAHLMRRQSECHSLESLYGGAPVMTSEFQAQELLPQVNEFYLWHGTKPSAAMSIVTDGFQISRAGLTHGAMFGKGAYFAEASSKSDEYAEAEAEDEGIYANLFAMFLCRVCCGRIHRELHPNKDEINRRVEAMECDSVLGDREGAVGTYREFVVFDVAQVYPEYLFVYSRDYEDEE